MGKRFTIVAVTLVALLLAGIAWAVARLYNTPQDTPREQALPAQWSVLRAVPSDAVAVVVFDGSAKAARVAGDSTGLLRSVVAPNNPELMPFLAALGREHMAVSLHNSGSLVPLVVAQLAQPDSILLDKAAQAGLKTRCKEGFLLASRSETFLNASARHLEEGSSILGNRGLKEVTEMVNGPVVTLVSHSHAGKILGVYTTPAVRKQASFVKDLTAWSAWVVQEQAQDHILLKGTALPGEEAASWFGAFAGEQAPELTFPEVLPYFTSTVLAMPVQDANTFLASFRKFHDGNGTLVRYNKALKAREGRDKNPEEWLLNLQPKEVVKASFRADDGVLREVVLIKSARDLKLGSERANEYRGNLATLLGERFAVTDTVCASVNSHWTVYGDLPAVRAFADKSFLDYSLKDRLQDASVPSMAGYTVYASLSDEPAVITDLFTGELADKLQAYVRGSGYAPASATLDVSGELPAMRIRLDKRVLKGSKVQVMERDTTVVVPTGLFPVQNYTTGETNYLYQNNHLSICLNDANGKGVWGIPFKEPLCGRVQNIDYYNNKKIQFLFAAGSSLYLLDRLGHWVSGFPVNLGKPVLLGPDAYDFTGAGGYTVMILHKDNSLERYNLHGQKPEGWKGIKAPEVVKNLPELLETKGKRYWAVRTSVQTLIYPFEGGEPLTREQGGKMLKPDAVLTPTSKGVSGECYDGKTRDFKLN